MARVDYSDIKAEIASILSASTDLATVQITVDDDIRLDSFGVSANVEIVRRDYTAPAQSLSAGQRQRYYLTAVVSVISVALDREAAVSMRDSVVGHIEVALMRNRTLNDKVDTLFLQGGDMFLLKNTSSNSEGYFIAAAEVVAAIDATITTV